MNKLDQHIIAPSLLAADFSKLPAEIDMFNSSAAAWLHLDVMDGRFVPNISFGMFIVKAIRKMTDKVLDAHLMIVEPEKYIDAFAKAGADIITVHYEACTHLHRTIYQIKETGAKAAVAINPHTREDLLDPVLADLDMVLVMSVNPGYGGQKFIPGSLEKIARLKAKIEDRNLTTLIQIDGGVKPENAELVLRAGTDVLVAGSAVFRSDNPLETIEKMSSIRLQTSI